MSLEILHITDEIMPPGNGDFSNGRSKLVHNILDANTPRALLLWLNNNPDNLGWHESHGIKLTNDYLVFQNQRISLYNEIKQVDSSLSRKKQLQLGMGFNMDEVNMLYESDIKQLNIMDIGKIFQGLPGDVDNKKLFFTVVLGMTNISDYWAYTEQGLGYYTFDGDSLIFQIPNLRLKKEKEQFRLNIRSIL